MNSTTLLTGATGYIGGRLLRALEEHGLSVRCLARRPEHLMARVGPQTSVIKGDCLKPESLRYAFEDIDTAYYLVRSMGSAKDFEEQDRSAAKNFWRAAYAALCTLEDSVQATQIFPNTYEAGTKQARSSVHPAYRSLNSEVESFSVREACRSSSSEHSWNDSP